MARYQVGQKILAGFFELAGRPHQKMIGNMFFPWEERIKYLHLVELTVEEHIRVPNAHDPKGEAGCDGFILRDNKGRRWFNQYPDASYGQISNDADYYFSIDNDKGFPGHLDDLLYFEDVQIMLERVSRGVRDFNEIIEQMALPPQERTNPLARNGMVHPVAVMKDRVGMLERHLTWMIKRIERDFKVKVEMKPHVVRYADGRPPLVMQDLLRAKLTWQDQPQPLLEAA